MTLLWFRRDLRSEDHPLLAIKGEVLPLFIFDPAILGTLDKNDKRVTLIFSTLMSLKNDLRSMGRDLALFYGDPCDVFMALRSKGFKNIVASGDYDLYARKRDHDVAQILSFTYVDDTYLFQPDEIVKEDGTPYHVFTPYYKKAQNSFRSHHAQVIPPTTQKLIPFDYDNLHCVTPSTYEQRPLTLTSLGFESATLPSWVTMSPQELLTIFKPKITTYPTLRDRIDLVATSRLGVALRFGTISIREIVRVLTQWKREGLITEPFFRQLIWREFYASMLYFYPSLATQNYKTILTPREGHDRNDHAKFEQFCQAQTGVPLIDAAITDLVSNGTMPNRARMITASFLTKNLLLPWQWGEAFFARHLLDYDAASNILSWQWSAGTGIDPQPFFRIFNPYLQTSKFDPQGSYIIHHLPHLSSINPRIFGSEEGLKALSLPNYPKPMVDYRTSCIMAKQQASQKVNK